MAGEESKQTNDNHNNNNKNTRKGAKEEENQASIHHALAHAQSTICFREGPIARLRGFFCFCFCFLVALFVHMCAHWRDNERWPSE